MRLYDLIREKKAGFLEKIESCGADPAKLYALLCEFDATGLSFRTIGCSSNDPSGCDEIWLTVQGEDPDRIEDLKTLVGMLSGWLPVEDPDAESTLYMKADKPITLGFDSEEGKLPTITMIYAHPRPNTLFTNSEYRGSVNVLMDEMADFLENAQ